MVIVINGYVLVDFFISEVKGLLFGSITCIGGLAYLAFIFYLISRGDDLPTHYTPMDSENSRT